MHYGTLSVIDCREMDKVAEIMKDINKSSAFDENRRDNIQRLDGFNPVLFYDFVSVIKVFVDLYNKGLIYRGLRMEGKNACWVPGTDHASIATEAKVVKKLAQDGISQALVLVYDSMRGGVNRMELHLILQPKTKHFHLGLEHRLQGCRRMNKSHVDIFDLFWKSSILLQALRNAF